MTYKTKATGAVANGYTLNLNASPTMPHLRLVGNAISLVQFVAIPAMSAFPVLFKELLKGKAHGANLSDSCSIFLRRLFRAGDNVLVNSLSVIVLSCIAMRRNTLHHGADGDYSGSLALRRWRYSTSRLMPQ